MNLKVYKVIVHRVLYGKMALSMKMNLDDAERTWVLADSSPIANQLGVQFNKLRRCKCTISTRETKERHSACRSAFCQIEWSKWGLEYMSYVSLLVAVYQHLC